MTQITPENGMCSPQVLEVKALIGYFDLDPNRAIALALQAYTAQPANGAYLPLFRLFVPDSVGQTLGFLFQHAQAAGDTPDSLFAVAVALMQVRVKEGIWTTSFEGSAWYTTNALQAAEAAARVYNRCLGSCSIIPYRPHGQMLCWGLACCYLADACLLCSLA